jgi:ABC-2 type transport system ATP-binding protein
MLQRVGIAQALINDPELVILDEPQTGLDPIGRREVREIILRLKNEKKTVFFSSHIMHDVETICEKVGIITLGRMRGIGRIHDLLSPKTIYYEVVYRLTDGKDALSLKSTPIESRRSGVDIVAKVDDESKLQALIHEIYKHQGSVLSVTPYRETLEDLFVQEVARSGKRVEL